MKKGKLWDEKEDDENKSVFVREHRHSWYGGPYIAPNWTPFDALVEVSIVAIKKLHKFCRLFQEKSLKKPLSMEETPIVVTVPVRNKQSRFGD